jgi:hypothetical protein
MEIRFMARLLSVRLGSSPPGTVGRAAGDASQGDVRYDGCAASADFPLRIVPIEQGGR